MNGFRANRINQIYSSSPKISQVPCPPQSLSNRHLFPISQSSTLALTLSDNTLYPRAIIQIKGIKAIKSLNLPLNQTMNLNLLKKYIK